MIPENLPPGLLDTVKDMDRLFSIYGITKDELLDFVRKQHPEDTKLRRIHRLTDITTGIALAHILWENK